MYNYINAIVKQYDFNLLYAKALVADLDEEQMTMVPSKGLDSHPAFTLGHLVTGSDVMALDLGVPTDLNEDWKLLFGRNGPNDQTRPDLDIAKYPLKAELLAELERHHEKVKAALMKAGNEMLNETVSWRLGTYMPAMSDLVLFMCISHENMHLGQLAAWRRAMDLPAALMTL